MAGYSCVGYVIMPTVSVGAIVLAGGAGSRMRPLTDGCPKPLLPLGPEPLIGYQLRRLAEVGVHDVVISTGYLAEQFDALLSDGSPWGLRLRHCAEREPLGTGGALRAAIDLLPGVDRVVVLNGDLLSSHDLAAQLDAATPFALCLHVRRVPDVAPYGHVTCDARARVRTFAEKTGTGAGLVNAGTYVVRADLLRALPIGRHSWERDVLPGLLAEDSDILGWTGDGYFRDVGSPTAYRLASVDAVLGALPGALTGDGSAHLAPTAQVAPTARLTGGCSVHAGARVGPDAVLDASVVLPGATVGAGARLTRCVVAAGAIVPAAGDVADAVVGAATAD